MKKLALVLVLAACATTKPAPTKALDYPGTLVPPESIHPDFLLRQKLTAHYGKDDAEFEAVLQKQGATLTLVGLAPWGGKAFALTQTGSAVEFHQYVPHDLPFDPRYMLLDIDRAFFMRVSDTPLADGTHAIERDGERITETWRDGKLRERTFVRLDGKPAGAITVRYEWGEDALFPAHLDFDNGWFGYRLGIETLSSQPL